MTDKQYMLCISEMYNYSDPDAYVSDLALDSMWGDAETDDVPEDRITALFEFWDAGHRSMKDIASDAGLSQRKLAERFCIPYRTMESWCGGQRDCPLYVKLMMQECLGLLHR